MDFRIAAKPAFKLVGFALQTSSEEGRNLREIPAFWQTYVANKSWERLLPYAIRRNNPVELGICTDMETGSCTFTYLIGMETDSFDGVPEDLVCREFPAAEYAVFTTPRTEREAFSATIQATWKSIFEEWFPQSEYEHAGTAEFEWYDDRSGPNAGDEQQMDIYIPVKRRQG